MVELMRQNSDNRHTLLCHILASSFLVALAGCQHGPPMARIRGKVHFKDGTIPHGELAIVKFNPTQDSKSEFRKSATGTIDPKDGSFEMNTRKAGDGVHFGDYTVTFTVARKNGSLLIVPKYAQPAETPYKITVDRDRTDLDYEVESATGNDEGGESAAGGLLGPG